MSTDLLIQGLLIKGGLTGILSLAFAWTVYSRYDDAQMADAGTERCPCRPVVHGALLPAYLLALLTFSALRLGTEQTANGMLAMCFDIFPHVSLYYLLLLAALPFLRKRISARACAVMWLLPNYLYLTQQRWSLVPRPLLVLHASSRVVAVLAGVWLAGVLAVFLWKIASHLRFRRAILRNAVPVTDPAVLDLLRDEEDEAVLKHSKYRLVRSPDVTTPLTIGLWERRSVIVLPQRDYGPEELRLILRHELVHIARRDSWAKFFMVFCTAMCWWNPLMWVAMKKSAEDVELSCDETVLLEADSDERYRYANLILRTAGDERGFTTCLSASASALRYRLKSIIKPGRRRTGALVVGVSFFVLSMTAGYVALAYGEATGADTVFGVQDPAAFTADSITVRGGKYEPKTDHVDAEALTQYIAGLRTQEMTGNYSYFDDEQYISLWYQGPDGMVVTDLYTDHLRVLNLFGEDQGWVTYHLPENVDWAYVDGIVPPMPEASVVLSDGDAYDVSDLDADVAKLTRVSGGERQVLRDRELLPDEGAGIYSSRTFTDAEITFSMVPVSPVEIRVESWDYGDGYTISEADPGGSVAVALPDYPAHYTVTTAFQGSDGIYETSFVFHIGAY